jgi:hypothetical protein
VFLPVTNAPRCVIHIVNTVGSQHLQLPDIAPSSGCPDGACIVHNRTDDLLLNQHTIYDRQVTSPVQEGPCTYKSLGCLPSNLVDEYRPSQPRIKDQQKTPCCFHSLYAWGRQPPKNQPTCAKRKTFSLPWLDKSSERSTQLELENSALQTKAGDVFTLKRLLSWLKAKGLLLLVRGWSRQAICPLLREFVWIDVWLLNSEILGSLWLKASATWGGRIHSSWRHPWKGVGERCPF